MPDRAARVSLGLVKVIEILEAIDQQYPDHFGVTFRFKVPAVEIWTDYRAMSDYKIAFIPAD
jgi:hypothetical protein